MAGSDLGIKLPSGWVRIDIAEQFDEAPDSGAQFDNSAAGGELPRPVRLAHRLYQH